MSGRPRFISGGQLVSLLFISRIFTLMTYVPLSSKMLQGSTSMLVILLSSIAAAIVIIPFLYLRKICHADLITCALRVNPIYGKVIAGLFCLFCLYHASFTLNHFEFFMTSTVYQGGQNWIFITGMILAAAYGAKMGLEAFSRMGILVFVVTIGILLLISGTLIPEINLVYVTSPLLEGGNALFMGMLNALTGNADIILFILLVGRVNQGRGRTFFIWIAIVTIAFELLSFITLTTLGNYAETRLFPLYTAATIAQLSIFGRMDLLHMTIWVFGAFIRTTMFVYCANVCLRRIFSRLSFGWGTVICALLCGVTSLITTPDMTLWLKGAELLYTAIPFGILVVAVPLITLLFPKAKDISVSGGEVSS